MQHDRWMSISRRQAGLISRAQLLAAGLTDRQVQRLAGSSAIRPLGFGVWRLSGAPASREMALWHAVLATRGVLVSSSAVYVWGCEAELTTPIEIANPHPLHNDVPDGVRLHRWRLDRYGVTTRDGLPVTSLAQSVTDYIASLRWPAAMTFADRAFSQGWVDAEQLEQRLRTRRPGNRVLRKVLATQRAGAEAESERRLHRLLRQAGVTGWVANHEVRHAGRLIARVDVAFPAERLAIEVDGFAYHSDRTRFQRDRSRQNDLVRLGWTVLRFTWSDLSSDRTMSCTRSALNFNEG